MIQMESPRITIRTSGLELDQVGGPVARGEFYLSAPNDGPLTEFAIIDRFPFRNYGRTAAFPETLLIGHAVTPTLAPEPIYPDTVDLGHDEVIRVEPQEEACFVRPHHEVYLDDEELVAAQAGAPLWVFGCLVYRDFMNNRREYRFCCRYAEIDADGTYEFACDGDPPEAYTHST
jgi:hypothetical protein